MNWETVWSTVIGTVIAALVLATVKYLFKQVKNADYYKKSIIIFIFCFIATIGAALFAVIPAHPTWLFVFLLACALWDVKTAFPVKKVGGSIIPFEEGGCIYVGISNKL